MFCRGMQKCFRSILQNKEKIIHLICAGIFLYLIQDINKLKQCQLHQNDTQVRLNYSII